MTAGKPPPGIIKYPFWQYTHEWNDAFYICINKGQCGIPAEIREKAVCLDRDIGQAIKERGRGI